MTRGSTPPARLPWWRGARGEWFVLAQVGLMALVFLGPRNVGGWPGWNFPGPRVCRLLGPALMAAGGALLAAAILQLGRGLTPLPYPKAGGRLKTRGPYALARHPMYGGGLMLALGWALCVQGWLTLAWVLALFLLLDRKARREERWLCEKFPTYRSYAHRVRRFFPFIY